MLLIYGIWPFIKNNSNSNSHAFSLGFVAVSPLLLTYKCKASECETIATLARYSGNNDNSVQFIEALYKNPGDIIIFLLELIGLND